MKNINDFLIESFRDDMPLDDINKLIRKKTGKDIWDKKIQYITFVGTSIDGEPMSIQLEKKPILYKKAANLFLGGFSGGRIELAPKNKEDKGFESAIDYDKPWSLRFCDLSNDNKYLVNSKGVAAQIGTMRQSEKMRWY